MDWLSLFNAVLFAQTIQAVTPILLAALAGVLCDRAGVFNIALEGQMLIGAFAAIAGTWYTGSVAGGVAVALIGTMAFSAILAFGSTWFRGDPIVIGIGLNLLASGLTAFLLRILFGMSGTFTDPTMQDLPRVVLPRIAAVPWFNRVFGSHSVLTWAAWILVAVIAVFLFRTVWGLRLRGVGERPDAAETLGADVARTRIAAVLAGGALCGLAGAQLSLGSVTLFAEDMSAGRGWIAVVAVMLGRGHPVGVALACLLFGFADAAGLRLQGRGLPNQLTDMAPYVITLVALVVARGRRRRRAMA
jgi:simple sugar transport system permease protein